MYGEYMYFAPTRKDQQVPNFQNGLEAGVDPTPLLEEILTHEQNTCIQIRDTCTLMAQSVRDVLGNACPQGGYVQVMQDKLGQLEKAVNSLETTIKRKSVFSNEFLDSASQRWFEKRLSSQSRKRRLRNFKRKESPASRVSTQQDSPPSTPTQYTFMQYDDPRFQLAPSTPSSPTGVPSPHSPRASSVPPLPALSALAIPTTSPNNSPRGQQSARSPSACVPSTPSYAAPIASPMSPVSQSNQEKLQRHNSYLNIVPRFIKYFDC